MTLLGATGGVGGRVGSHLEHQRRRSLSFPHGLRLREPPPGCEVESDFQPNPETNISVENLAKTHQHRRSLSALPDFRRGTARAEEGTPTQSHISPSILVYEARLVNFIAFSLVFF